ncbi:MAG: ankyrin repeat domain-containing protein [Wolbachia sp.]
MGKVTEFVKNIAKFTNEQKIEEAEQDWQETDEPFSDGYELLKEEYLLQASCDDRLETLRHLGYSKSEIDEICSQGDSWYTQTVISPFESYNQVSPSLMDSRDSLRKQVCVWFSQRYGLTEDQEKLNKELLSILQYLDCYEDNIYCYDNGSADELERFLEVNKNNPDLKVVLDLPRGKSGVTVLHAVSGACTNETSRDRVDRALDLFLKAGANPNTQNDEGETPLHYAAAIGNSKGVSSLLLGSAKNICDKQGKTPQRVAIDGGHYNVVGLFLTKEQEELRRELYNIFVIPIFGPIRLTKTLKEFLDKHKSNPDLKVVLNTRSERGKSEVLEFAKNILHLNKAIGAEIRGLLLEAGVSDNVCHHIVEKKLTCVLWRNLMPNQQKELDDFLDRVSKAEDMDKLEKVIDEAIRSGVRLSLNKDFSPQYPFLRDWHSFADCVVKRIGELKKNPKVASDIICKLISKGAIFYTRNSIDVIEELELEFKDLRANINKTCKDHTENTHKFIKIAKSATNGKLKDIRVDNSTLYLEYSGDSTVYVAKITDGARYLGLTQGDIGYERNVVKIGKSEVEIITKNGIRDYTDLADGSDVVLTFYTSQGELEVRLYPDKQNKDLIRVEVQDREKWEKLRNCEEEIGKNRRLGGLSVNQAIGQGFFGRPGKLIRSETISPSNGQMKVGLWTEREKIKRVSNSENAVSIN